MKQNLPEFQDLLQNIITYMCKIIDFLAIDALSSYVSFAINMH